MYRIGHRLVRHYLRYALVPILLVALVGGGWAVVAQLQPNTIIRQSPAVVRYVPATDQPNIHVAKSIFAMDLPAGWQAMADPTATAGVYSWRGTATPNDQSRWLEVYVDRPVSSLAVNRLLPVQGSGSALEITGSVSDNCINFTDKTPTSEATGQAPSKWSGISFICDTGNYERDVVATGSPEGINTVTLTGATSGQHHILLLYTDNSASPDYTIFLAIVRSFHLI